MAIKPQLRAGELERAVQALKDAHELMKHFGDIAKDLHPSWADDARSFAAGTAWVMEYQIVKE